MEYHFRLLGSLQRGVHAAYTHCLELHAIPAPTPVNLNHTATTHVSHDD